MCPLSFVTILRISFSSFCLSLVAFIESKDVSIKFEKMLDASASNGIFKDPILVAISLSEIELFFNLKLKQYRGKYMGHSTGDLQLKNFFT